MFNKNKITDCLKTFIVATFTIGSFTVSAATEPKAGVVFAGQLETKNPLVSADTDGEAVAHVKEFQLSVVDRAGLCNLKDELSVGHNSFVGDGQLPNCIFEWTGTINGLSLDGVDLSGVLAQSGKVTFEYSLSVMDNGEKVNILTDSLTVDVKAPIVPEILDVITNWSDGSVSGDQQETFNLRRRMMSLELKVEERPYVQRIGYAGDTCEIKVGQSSCSIQLSGDTPGADDTDLIGDKSFSLSVTDIFDHFTPKNKSLKVSYDYRAPSLSELVVNSNADREELIHTIDGVEYTVPFNHALAVIETPHVGREGKWWMPQVSNLELFPQSDSDLNEFNSIEINGVEIRSVRPSDIDYAQVYRPRFTRDFEIVGNKVVGLLNISGLPDGTYSTDIEVSDTYQNVSEEVGNEIQIDRNAPKFAAVMGKLEVMQGYFAETIFMSDFYFKVISPIKGDTQVLSVKFDGQDIGYEQLEDGSFHLVDSEGLPTGSDIPLEIRFADNAGNEGVASYRVNYMDLQFDLVATADEIFEDVQESKIYVYQSRGPNCSFASDVEVAKKLSNGYGYGCKAEIIGAPSDYEFTPRGRMVLGEGYISEAGEYPINFNVTFYNEAGDSKTIEGDPLTLKVTPPPPIELTASRFGKVRNDLYGVNVNRDRFTNLEVLSAPGKIDINYTTSSGSETRNLVEGRGNRLLNRHSSVPMLFASNSEPWSVETYTVNADYAKQQGKGDELTFDAVTLPHSGVRVRLEGEGVADVNTTLDTLQFNGKIGLFVGREFTYDKSLAGEWTGQLAVRDGLDFTPISEEFAFDENGEISFTVSGQTLFEEDRAFYLLAKAIHELDGFDYEIASSPAKVNVLKGEAVDGSVDVRRQEGRIPFTTFASFFYKTRDDAFVSGDIEWQVSDDGQSWETLSVSDRNLPIRIDVDEIGETFYRVKTNNKVTGNVGFSDVLNVVGYDVADININGPTVAMRGYENTFTAELSDELYNEGDGRFEWSLDDGESWTEGAETFTHTAQENFTLSVRYILNDTAALGVSEYATDFHRVSTYDPEEIRIYARKPRFAEVGIESSIEFSTIVSYATEQTVIQERLTLPNGDVIEADSVTFVPAPEDIENGVVEFTYEAWVQGLKDSTYSKVTERITTYNYNLNDVSLDLRQFYTIAPTSVRANAIVDAENMSPHVQLDYQWNPNNVQGVTIDREIGSVANMTVSEAGIKPIELIVKDNRGNELSITEYVDVNEAEPVELTTRHSFSKDAMTVPIVMTNRLSAIKMSHPSDRVDTINWYVNGQLVESGYRISRVSEIDTPGTYEIKIEVIGTLGSKGVAVDTFEIAPNVPPQCNPQVEDEETYMALTPNCTDTDGSVVAYKLEYDDVVRSSFSRNITFNKSDYPNLTVTITATDNGGESTIETVSW